MCGISGIFSNIISKNEREFLLNKMLETIVHRGPDYTGIWSDETVSLGHQRLKIIDLSDEANHPFEFMGMQIIFNGEIYNYIELREELRHLGYQFRTSSDTEVIMAAYKEWGENCVNRFVGMWAFVIWNPATKVLFCSRDRFGIKPFYYIENNNSFYFASEYKPLKSLPIFDNNLNYDQLKRGIALGWSSYENDTFFTQIKILQAAHNLTITQDGKVLITKYWDIEDTSDSTNITHPNQLEETFLNLFNQAVKIHSRSDVKIGGCLSGGMDSSAIASSFAFQFPEVPFNTFTIYYDGKGNVDERPFANEVAAKYPTIRQHTLNPSHDDIARIFHKATFHNDIPIAVSSFISQHFVMQLAAKNGVVVVLDGQGADEFLGGYMHIFQRILGENLSHFQVVEYFKNFLNHKRLHNLGWSDSMSLILKSIYMSLNEEADVYRYEYNKYKGLFSETANENKIGLPNFASSKPNQMLYHSIFSTSLPTLLHYEDRNSMAYSLESRVPFLDHRLVEFAFGLPMEMKVNKNAETKTILRRALKDVLPETIVNRHDKKGFVAPGEVEWLNGPLKFLFDEMDYSKLDYLDTKNVKGLINQYRNGDRSKAALVWKILNQNYWLKHFVKQ